MCAEDAVDENELILCCALCCINCSIYPSLACLGCSGKAGIFCCNAECCCKPGAPCLCPFGCIGCKFENDGLSVINAQLQALCVVCSAAIPCNEEVPLAVSIAGLTIFPTCGCCITQKALKQSINRS